MGRRSSSVVAPEECQWGRCFAVLVRTTENGAGVTLEHRLQGSVVVPEREARVTTKSSLSYVLKAMDSCTHGKISTCGTLVHTCVRG